MKTPESNKVKTASGHKKQGYETKIKRINMIGTFDRKDDFKSIPMSHK
jgi:hypothetical protein